MVDFLIVGHMCDLFWENVLKHADKVSFYIGMAHPAPTTNTNFQITFLLTQLLKALYEDLPV